MRPESNTRVSDAARRAQSAVPPANKSIIAPETGAHTTHTMLPTAVYAGSQRADWPAHKKPCKAGLSDQRLVAAADFPHRLGRVGLRNLGEYCTLEILHAHCMHTVRPVHKSVATPSNWVCRQHVLHEFHLTGHSLQADC